MTINIAELHFQAWLKPFKQQIYCSFQHVCYNSMLFHDWKNYFNININFFLIAMSNIPVSLVFAFPAYIWRKSWYSSLVLLTCNFVAEYIFMIEKKLTSSSNKPAQRAPEFARISPNLSQVQCGIIIGLVWLPCAWTSCFTLSNISCKNWLNVLLHLPR